MLRGRAERGRENGCGGQSLRAAIAQVLARIFRIDDSRLTEVFPGAGWDRSLDALVRRG